MPLSLFVEEMREEFLRRQDLDPLFKTKLKGLTFRLVMLSLDAPGGQDRQMAMNLQGGRFINIVYDTRPSPSELRTMPFDRNRFDARITAPHELFVELCQGKIEIMSAFPKVKIEGDMSKLMGQIEGFVGIIDYMSTMDIVP
ncbi:MAG: SCP2 sterol-binding domain-containing protein [Chloroflexota bacterium]|nr:SCP2 sterol-binding domain-containing protein [Chloroflexota bacterium]